MVTVDHILGNGAVSYDIFAGALEKAPLEADGGALFRLSMTQAAGQEDFLAGLLQRPAAAGKTYP